MEITNSSITAKYARKATFKGWNIEITFETDNNILVKNEISATAQKNTTTIKQSSSDSLNQIVTVNGQNDYELAAAIDNVFEGIRSEFAVQAPAAPTT